MHLMTDKLFHVTGKGVDPLELRRAEYICTLINITKLITFQSGRPMTYTHMPSTQIIKSRRNINPEQCKCASKNPKFVKQHRLCPNRRPRLFNSVSIAESCFCFGCIVKQGLGLFPPGYHNMSLRFVNSYLICN